MTPDRLHLEIVTPTRRVLVHDVDEVVLPGVMGSFGVRPGHAPLLAGLAAGLAICRDGDRTEVLALSGGFAEVQAGRVIVLAETCERAGEVDSERARAKVAELEKRMKEAMLGNDEEIIRMRLMKHIARLEAASKAH